MHALLYLTVWISLSLFAIAELARANTSRAWPRAVSAAGLTLMIVHILIAMGAHHEWRHTSAMAATAEQTREVYGVAWGGGVYVNYVFTIVWGLWLVPGWQVPGFWGQIARGLFLIVIANAAIVFATGWRRWLGVAIVGVLALAWFRRDSRST